MYNIADFLHVQLSLSRFTLIKSAQSTDVYLNYISTAQFYQSDNQNIRCHHNITHYLVISASQNFFSGFSADKNSASNPVMAMAEGSNAYVV